MARRRRRMDADTRYRIMEVEAWRTIARRHPWKVVLGPFIARGLGLGATVGVLAYLWVKVPHLYLGVAALVIAGVVGVGWVLWTNSNAALQRRMRSGAARRGVGLGWAVAGLVVLLGSTGWLALWSPYA